MNGRLSTPVDLRRQGRRLRFVPHGGEARAASAGQITRRHVRRVSVYFVPAGGDESAGARAPFPPSSQLHFTMTRALTIVYRLFDRSQPMKSTPRVFVFPPQASQP